jgi:hypothetical protein
LEELLRALHQVDQVVSVTRDRSREAKNIFAKKYGEKIGGFAQTAVLVLKRN